MDSAYIRGRIIGLIEKRNEALQKKFLLVAKRLQRDIDYLNKELKEIEQEESV